MLAAPTTPTAEEELAQGAETKPTKLAPLGEQLDVARGGPPSTHSSTNDAPPGVQPAGASFTESSVVVGDSGGTEKIDAHGSSSVPRTNGATITAATSASAAGTHPAEQGVVDAHQHQGPAPRKKRSSRGITSGRSSFSSVPAVSFPDASEILAQSPTAAAHQGGEDRQGHGGGGGGGATSGGKHERDHDLDMDDSSSQGFRFSLSQSGTSIASSTAWSEAFDADTSGSVSCPLGVVCVLGLR